MLLTSKGSALPFTINVVKIEIYLVHKLAEVFECLRDVLVYVLIALLQTALDAGDSCSILLLLSIKNQPQFNTLGSLINHLSFQLLIHTFCLGHKTEPLEIIVIVVIIIV